MLGIVILNYNSHLEVVNCINSIKFAITSRYMIYLVDNCSLDNSYKILKDYYSDCTFIKVISTTKNIGYARGNNFGAKVAISDGVNKILIVNTDILFKPNSIDQLINCISEKISVVGPRVLDKDNKDSQFASKLLTFSGYIFTKKPLNILFPNKKEYRYYDISKEVGNFVFSGMCSGCCFMIDATVFEKIGFFDENTFLFYEEDILAYKLKSEEKMSMICNESQVVHLHSTSVKKEGSAFIRYHRFISSLYVLRYYANLSDFKFIIVALLNLIPFSFNAIFDIKYRKLSKFFFNQIVKYYRKRPL